jgi:ribosomal protein L37E
MESTSPLSCPDCGSTSVGKDEDESLWKCRDCDHRFLDLTPVTWQRLLITMLPSPTSQTDQGTVGGSPGEVIVRVTDESVEVAAYRAELRGGAPVIAAKKWKVFDLDTGPSEVAKAIQKARARRLRTYRWCVTCRRVLPPEQMLDSVTCNVCAEA